MIFKAFLAAAALVLPPQQTTQAPPPAARPQPQAVVPARANDNRAKAGILYGSTLALRLEARLAEWHPNGNDEPGAVVPAFAEQGRAPQIPGPLVRVPGGTDVVVTVRNAIPNTTLTVHGLHTRPAIGPFFNDSIVLPSGAMETLRFRLDRPGTYYYWGTTTGRSFATHTRDDAQLTGAIVVDQPDERPPKDRIIVLGMWTDTVATPQLRHRTRELFVMNGRAWPYTERMQFERGDSVRWRVINASADLHAMHLHGYYFRVSHRGNGRVDSLVATRDVEHTERMVPGETMSLAWYASRLGTWLFHCDVPAHFAPRGALGFAVSRRAAPQESDVAGRGGGSPDYGMGGAVTAVDVIRGEDDTASVPGLVNPARALRLTIEPVPGSHYYSMAVQEGALGAPSLTSGDVHAGPPVVLNRGEATQVMVLNHTAEPTSIHWHGLELASFFDGVPGVSGERPDTAGAIAPQDSFDVRITAPRAGTFLYHSHVDAARQMADGIVGPLLVVDKRTYDASKEILFLVTSPADSALEERAVFVNGMEHPAAVELRKGGVYRLRVLNGTTARPDLVVSLHDAEPADSAEGTWRALAKDGWELPAAQKTLSSAHRALTIGETADFEISAARAGDFRVEALGSDGAVLGALDLHVR